MRVCFIVHQATKEGAGRYMLDQVDYLVGHGVSVNVVLPETGPLSDALLERSVPFRVIKSPWWTKAAIGNAEPDFAATLGAAREMAALFREWSIDVVYTETIVIPTGAFAAALAGLPHIWHIHEFSYNPGLVEMAIGQPSMARLIELTSNRVFFNSKAVAAEWTALIPSAKTDVIYNWTSPFVDDGPPDTHDAPALELLSDERRFVVAIVGSVLRWKRQEDAIDAVARLGREGIDIALLVVGPPTDAAYAEELNAMVKRGGLSERIRFLGYTEHPQRIMRAVDVTVMCSDREPFGRVTVESMAHGTPVIGTNSGGTSEIIEDGVDGLLFPTGDADALAEQLKRLIQDSALRARLSTAAKEKATRFQSANLAMSPVVAHLQALVGERNPSWPLASLIDAGLDGTAIVPSSPGGRAPNLLRRFFRGKPGQ